MKRTVILIIMLSFTLCQPAYSHTFEVMKASEDYVEVIIFDRETDEEWVVEVGDEIYGYRIIEITEDYVTIAKPGEDRVINVTNIPIRGGNQTKIISPQ